VLRPRSRTDLTDCCNKSTVQPNHAVGSR
jgi:hypothetical protein